MRFTPEKIDVPPLDPKQHASYRYVHEDLTARGFGLTNPNEVDPVSIRNKLADVIGMILKTELTTDPESRGYASMTDAEKVSALCDPYFRRMGEPYQIVSSTPFGDRQTILTVVKPDLSPPSLLLLGQLTQKRIRITRGTNVGVVMTIVDYSDDTITYQKTRLVNPLIAGDRFVIEDVGITLSRISFLLAKIPFAPNAIETTDLTAILV